MSEQPVQGVPQWTIGDRLGKSLSHAGLSVGAMADYLGISRNTVGNYVNDRTRIPRPTLILWSMKTGLPVEWIETGATPDSSPSPDGGGSRTDDRAARLAALAASKRSDSLTGRYSYAA